MKPGETTLPAASMVRLRGASERWPMETILPSRIPTSAEYQGEPVPSMMCPLVMTRSKGCGVWAKSGVAISTRSVSNLLDIEFSKVVSWPPLSARRARALSYVRR